MAYIPCTGKCIYESDGLCTLENVAAAGCPTKENGCAHFIPRDISSAISPAEPPRHLQRESAEDLFEP